MKLKGRPLYFVDRYNDEKKLIYTKDWNWFICQIFILK